MLSTNCSSHSDEADTTTRAPDAVSNSAASTPTAAARAGSDPRASVRIIGVLTALAEAGEAQSLSHIAETVGLPVSTVHRILDQLVELGLVERMAHRQYGVGDEFSRIGALAAQKLDIARLARPLMHQVVQNSNETCLLGLYMPLRRKLAFVEKIDARYPLKYRVSMNVHRTLAWGAAGHAILAWLPQTVIEEILAADERSIGRPSVPVDPVRVREKLAQVREQGYAMTRGEHTPDAVGIAAPVFRAGGRVVGDLCLTIPAFRFDATAHAHYARLLVTAATQLSRALGALPTNTP